MVAFSQANNSRFTRFSGRDCVLAPARVDRVGLSFSGPYFYFRPPLLFPVGIVRLSCRRGYRRRRHPLKRSRLGLITTGI